MTLRSVLFLLAASLAGCLGAGASEPPEAGRSGGSPLRPPDLFWSAGVRTKIARNVRYPAHLRNQAGEGPSGKVVVWIKVHRSGKVLKAEIRQSSGVSELDQVALDAVRRSDPFEPPPPILAAHEPEILAPLDFRAR